MSRFRISPFYCLLLALVSSASLTIITLTPPDIPADWARLNQNGIYIPLHLAYHWPSYVLQVALWLLMIAALWAAVSPKRISAVSKGTRHVLSLQIPLLTITLLGFGLRLYSLNRLPLIVDEIGFAAHASDILHGQAVPIFAPGHNANPSVYSWLVAGAMALFGQNTFAIRLIPLAFGTLSIPAAYLLGREWGSKRVGLLAAAFLATYPAHVFYSRLSLYNIVDPFFAMLALAWLARGIRSVTPTQPPPQAGEESNMARMSPPRLRGGLGRGEYRYFVLAGIAAGIAQYFYHGSRMLPLLMAVYIGVWILKKLNAERQRNRGTVTFTLRFSESLNLGVNSLWLLATFVIVALPRYAPMLLVKLPLTGNMEAMRLPADLADNTLRAALAWVGEPDVSPFWLSDQPLLLLPALLAFLLGLWVCLRRWRDARSVVLLLAIPLTTIFGGAIWTAAPLFVRYITAIPVIVLLVALGMEKLMIANPHPPTPSPLRSEGEQSHLKPPLYVIGRGFRGEDGSKKYIGTFVVLIIILQGIYVSLFLHPQQAYDAIVPGHWEEDALAMQAAQLPPDAAAVLLVSPDFGTDDYDGPLQMMSIAHYVAAYGERRAVVVNQHNPLLLKKQLIRLGSRPYMTLEVTTP